MWKTTESDNDAHHKYHDLRGRQPVEELGLRQARYRRGPDRAGRGHWWAEHQAGRGRGTRAGALPNRRRSAIAVVVSAINYNGSGRTVAIHSSDFIG